MNIVYFVKKKKNAKTEHADVVLTCYDIWSNILL
jgi:hypothetical protein